MACVECMEEGDGEEGELWCHTMKISSRYLLYWIGWMAKRGCLSHVESTCALNLYVVVLIVLKIVAFEVYLEEFWWYP